MAAKPIPDGYHSVTPYLVVRNAAKAIEFYKKALGAQELFRMAGEGDAVAHAEIKIGDSVVMLADETDEYKSPDSFGGTPVTLLLYVEDVDAVFPKAIAAGGKELRPVTDQFYGDRSGMLRDPFGHLWNIATHKEDLTPEQMDERFAEALKSR